MADLPLRLDWPAASDRWKTEIQPVINFSPNQGILLTNQTLNNGVTVINHKLGKTQQGWIITDITSAATIFRSQPFNSLTLTLTSTAAATCNIWCY